MKRLSAVFIIIIILFLSSCSANLPEKPEDGNLDFWIAENVDNVDFSEYDEVPGWFGAREFLGKDYELTTNKNGESVKPEHYVSYIVTAYPDYSSDGQYVTTVEITDPEVQIYGLSVTSSLEESDAVFKSKGYDIEEVGNTGLYHKAVKGKISFTYGAGSLRVSVEVTNRFGIVF